MRDLMRVLGQEKYAYTDPVTEVCCDIPGLSLLHFFLGYRSFLALCLFFIFSHVTISYTSIYLSFLSMVSHQLIGTWYYFRSLLSLFSFLSLSYRLLSSLVTVDVHIVFL